VDELVRAWLGPRLGRRYAGVFDPVSILAGITVIAILAGSAYAYWPVLSSNALASACIQNEQAISDAAELYHARVPLHIYPATGTVVAATFTDATGTDMLQSVPKDESDRTGTGAYTFTNTSANGTDSYIISCPGQHSPGALQGLPGWVATSQTIYMSGGQVYTQ